MIAWTDSQCIDHEYSPDYGTGMCDAWDEDLDPFCNVANPPDFCDKEWCYVSSACTAGDVLDTALFGIDLKYSY